MTLSHTYTRKKEERKNARNKTKKKSLNKGKKEQIIRREKVRKIK